MKYIFVNQGYYITNFHKRVKESGKIKSITPDDNDHIEKKWNYKLYCHDYCKGDTMK
jgi:hypothetical protein